MLPGFGTDELMDNLEDADIRPTQEILIPKVSEKELLARGADVTIP